jgi:hypothetical protein
MAFAGHLACAQSFARCGPTCEASDIPEGGKSMSASTSSRRPTAFLLAVLLAGPMVIGLTGCGEKEVDPYVYASLRAVSRGDTLSFNFLYEIDVPEFEYVRGNTAIVRDGNLLEFLVGSDLENNYPSLGGSLLGVQKFFSPEPHLMIKRIKRAGVIQPVDSCTAYVVPKLLRGGAVDLETPGADLPGLRWNRTRDFNTFQSEEEDQEIQVQSMIETFVLVPRHDLPDSVRANPSETDMAWYAIFENSTLEIVDLTPGAKWMLHLLKDRNLPLVGSFTVTEFYDSIRDRRREWDDLGHIIGKVRINWFRYANAFVQGAEIS